MRPSTGGLSVVVRIRAVRERGAARRQLATRYYNVNIHKAALAPEFVREALGE